MDNRTEQLIETRRAEAIALFQVGQASRFAAERIIALIFAAIAIVVAAGVNSGSDDVVIPLPPLVLVLLSYMFQQYADVSVNGAARARLEDAINAELRAAGLLYETAVADIRKEPPLRGSVRLLQALTGMLVLAVTVFATIVAFDEQPTYVELGYTFLTAGSLASACWSFRAMLASFDLASRRIESKLDREHIERQAREACAPEPPTTGEPSRDDLRT